MQARSLFTKIFLWFWLAIILVAVAAIISGAWIRPYTDTSEEHARHFARMLQSMPAQMTADVWQRGGRQALRDQLNLWKRHTGLEGFLFDSKAEELAGQTAPPDIRALAVKAIKSRSVEVQRLGQTMYAATFLTTDQHRSYVYVSAVPAIPSHGAIHGPSSPPDRSGPPPEGSESPERPGPPPDASSSPDRPGPLPVPVVSQKDFRLPPPLGFLLEQPERLALALVAVIITGGAVCYWLARTLTSPLARLSATATIVVTPNGAPIRTIVTGRRPIVTGTYASRKAGRPLPYESMLERAFFMHSEVDPDVVDYRAQPFRLDVTP